MNWEAALHQYGNLVRQVCYEYEKNPDDLEELIQDVWGRAFEKSEQFNGGSDFGTWLHAVAESVARNRLRSQESRPEILYYADLAEGQVSLEDAEFDYYAEPADFQEALVSSMGLPDEWAQAEQVSELIEKHTDISKLTWLVLHLQAGKGCTTEEISELLDIEESTVRTYLQRVREQIDRILVEANEPVTTVEELPPWEGTDEFLRNVDKT